MQFFTTLLIHLQCVTSAAAYRIIMANDFFFYIFAFAFNFYASCRHLSDRYAPFFKILSANIKYHMLQILIIKLHLL